MTTCQNCETTLPDGAGFCPGCGERSAAATLPAVEAHPSLATLGGLETLGEAETGRRASRGMELPTPGTRFADRYIIGEPIGMGGMGVVVRARDELTSRDVALKLIRSDRLGGEREVQRIIAEGVTTREIRHENVVSVYDVGVEAGQPFMTMERIVGKSLRAWLREAMAEDIDIPVPIAKRIVQEICAGLAAAHGKGVIHRDLKPENVILLATPSAERAPLKILDFGIAHAGSDSTGSGGANGLGTPRYMAPEQATQADLVKESADIYSLSVMLYELLVGVLPQGHWQPPSGGRSDVPRAVDAIVEKGLSSRPAARQQSAEEYSIALDRAVRSSVHPMPALDELKENLLSTGRLEFTRSMKIAAAVVAALLFLGVLAESISGGEEDWTPTDPEHALDFDGDPVDEVWSEGDSETAGDLRPYRELTGSWTDDFGNDVDMRVMSSGRLRGTGYYPENGARYTVRGQFDGAQVDLTIATAGLPDVYGTGVWNGRDRIRFVFRDGYGNPLSEAVYVTP